MSTAERIVIAVCMGIVPAGLGAALSLAVGTKHIWPGTAVAFAMGTLLSLAMTRRWQR